MGADGIEHLAICTPVYDGRAHASFFRGITDIVRTLKAKGIVTAFMDAGHSANLPRLRNGLTAKALDWGADAICWIDSDIAASGKDVLALIESGMEIIGAAPQRRPLTMQDEVSVAFQPLPNGSVKFSPALIEVGAIATAFALTRREVYDKLRKEGIAKPLVNRDGGNSEWFCNFFWYELVETSEGWLDDGEDYYFCRKAREVGFSVFIEPSVRPVHHEGRMRLPVNFMDIYGEAIGGA